LSSSSARRSGPLLVIDLQFGKGDVEFLVAGLERKLGTGGVLVAQMKDVDPSAGLKWETVVRTELTGRKEPDWLQAGDILFVPRGQRFFASSIGPPPGLAVCGPHLVLLRLRPGARVTSDFLAWQINQPPVQKQLRIAAEGTNQLHTFLATKLGAAFPTAAQEAQEPGEADRLYESATRWLLEQTRDTSKYSLLFTENISYGFRRNMLGMRWIGLTAAILAAIWLVLDTVVALPATWANLGGLLVAMPTGHRLGVTVCAAAAGVWILGVSKDRVRAAAFSYAERLVAACESLADRPPASVAQGSGAAKQNLGGAGAG